MAVILAALVLVASFRGVYIIIEQPASSVLYRYRPLRRALWKVAAGSLQTYLKCFCKDFPITKPLRLACTCPWALHLARKKPAGRGGADQTVYTRDDFDHSVTGGPLLADTAAYPWEFAVAVPSFFFAVSLLFFFAGRGVC